MSFNKASIILSATALAAASPACGHKIAMICNNPAGRGDAYEFDPVARTFYGGRDYSKFEISSIQKTATGYVVRGPDPPLSYVAHFGGNTNRIVFSDGTIFPCRIIKVKKGITTKEDIAPAMVTPQLTPMTVSLIKTSLDGANVRIGVYCCAGVGSGNLASNVVAARAPHEFVKGSLYQTRGGLFVIPVAINVEPSRLVIRYPDGGRFGVAPFNGYHFAFSGVAPITNVTLDPQSTFRPRRVSFTSDSVDVNVSGQATGDGTQAILDIVQGSAPQTAPAGDVAGPAEIVGSIVNSSSQELQTAIRAWMKSVDPDAKSILQTYVFMEPGAPLAAVFVDYDNGAAHVQREGMVFKYDASGWGPAGVPLEVFGDIIGGRAVSPNSVLVETKVLRPGDGNCCPTGRKTWTLNLHKAATAESLAKAAVSPAFQAGRQQQQWISPTAGVGFGIADDGVSQFDITCGGHPPEVAFSFGADGYHGHALKKVLCSAARF